MLFNFRNHPMVDGGIVMLKGGRKASLWSSIDANRIMVYVNNRFKFKDNR